jgi:RNA polymerase sigma-70 factor (ECF subfamily)
VRKYGRRNSREVFSPVEFENHPADDPERAAGRQSEASLLRSQVASLPAGQREAVEELALAETSLEDASKATGRTKTSLKVNLHRAIKTLRGRMSGVER